MPKSTFILVEQSYLIRKGLSLLIEKIPNTQIIQQFDNSEEFKLSKGLETDFVIINKTLVDIEFIQKKFKKPQIIILTNGQKEKTDRIEWAEYIELNDSQSTLLQKLNKLIGNKDSEKPKFYTPEEISEREADIVRNIALGYSNKEIADKLYISTHTVVTHRKNITRKLGIKTVPGLTIYAILNKLIDINEAE